MLEKFNCFEQRAELGFGSCLSLHLGCFGAAWCLGGVLNRFVAKDLAFGRWPNLADFGAKSEMVEKWSILVGFDVLDHA